MEFLSLPYVFPHESLFVAGCFALIVLLLVYRVRLVQKRRSRDQRSADAKARRDEIEV